MGIDFSDADGIEPELLQQAQSGEIAMKNIPAVANPIISPESVKGSGGQKSFEQVMIAANNNMEAVKDVSLAGGFTGPDKDKFDLIEAYNEWVKARNENINCPNQITKTSVRYTTLVNGKVDQNQIIKAHQDRVTTKESCDKSSLRVTKAAEKYIEIDRRVNDNKLKSQNSYPVNTMSTDIIEGFNYYNVDDSYIDNPTVAKDTYSQRLPRYTQSNKTIMDISKSILPWGEYYTDCQGDKFCENAHQLKDKYIASINSLFDKADEKLKLYQNAIQLKSMDMSNASSKNTLDKLLDANNQTAIYTAIENQKKEINLYKQQALYNYDQYNSLSFMEDMFVFVYYAVFAIFVYMSIRDFYSSGTYDKRNIIVVILLAIYPKYILIVVVRILNLLTDIIGMFGINNVSFWW
jgi:hypothetical protein